MQRPYRVRRRENHKDSVVMTIGEFFYVQSSGFDLIGRWGDSQVAQFSVSGLTQENPETRFLVDFYCSKQRFILESGFVCVSPNILILDVLNDL